MLTPKQQRVLDAITGYIRDHGESPTLEELQQTLELKNKRSVSQFLEYLDRKGYISKGRGYRSIRLGERIVASQLAIPIPILGYANAGRPLVYADEAEQGKLLISKSVILGDEKKYFCVRVQGTSMNQFVKNGKTMADGSFALVDSSCRTIESGSDAYLCIVNGAATLKKLKKEGNSIYLIPESNDPIHHPMILSEDDAFEINGKVVDIFNFS